ncbi:MAG: hypothetical protein KF875_12500 [Trueperaceae bacterium]|nr:hypothetical protein [Trueperaceae bacterium]MCO5175139.1 hypothetical protein [Trueperaceae bacterium]MCW5819064.1 hypothetical protein [Trueperaceae bacterium]
MGFATGRSEDSVEERLAVFMQDLRANGIGAVQLDALQQALAGGPEDEPRVVAALNGLYETLGENPAPVQEARVLIATLGEERLAALLLVSKSSVQRYARGKRQAPEVIVERLHWLALLVGYLHGVYNDFGVRRWFDRPRVQLDGLSPAEALESDGIWTPDTPWAVRVMELGMATLGMVAT